MQVHNRTTDQGVGDSIQIPQCAVTINSKLFRFDCRTFSLSVCGEIVGAPPRSVFFQSLNGSGVRPPHESTRRLARPGSNAPCPSDDPLHSIGSHFVEESISITLRIDFHRQPENWQNSRGNPGIHYAIFTKSKFRILDELNRMPKTTPFESRMKRIRPSAPPNRLPVMSLRGLAFSLIELSFNWPP